MTKIRIGHYLTPFFASPAMTTVSLAGSMRRRSCRVDVGDVSARSRSSNAFEKAKRAPEVEVVGPAAGDRAVLRAVLQALLQQAVARVVDSLAREAVLERALELLARRLLGTQRILRRRDGAERTPPARSRHRPSSAEPAPYDSPSFWRMRSIRRFEARTAAEDVVGEQSAA